MYIVIINEELSTKCQVNRTHTCVNKNKLIIVLISSCNVTPKQRWNKTRLKCCTATNVPETDVLFREYHQMPWSSDD